LNLVRKTDRGLNRLIDHKSSGRANSPLSVLTSLQTNAIKVLSLLILNDINL